jgi:hypothetical protein
MLASECRARKRAMVLAVLNCYSKPEVHESVQRDATMKIKKKMNDID